MRTGPVGPGIRSKKDCGQIVRTVLFVDFRTSALVGHTQ